MPRWEPNTIGRLQEAAIELFEERGFEQTTVAQIAGRAGVTERSFYNHFGDKREVLFGPRTERHQQLVLQQIVSETGVVDPLESVVTGLQAAADELFAGLRDASARRRRIIDAHPDLRERDDGKRAALTAAVAAALRERGMDSDTALLTARTGVLVEQDAEERWVRHDHDSPLRDHLADALTALRSVLDGGLPGSGHGSGGRASRSGEPLGGPAAPGRPAQVRR